ncbi:MAG: DUF5703 domain-containing protein [Bacteroides sp.]
MRHKTFYLVIFLICWSHSLYAHKPLPKSVLTRLSTYNVCWDTPSTSGSLECMPIGNGDITANVWAEKEDDLLFYISKSDSWSEATRLLKIGRVRIHLTPNPLATCTRFRQTLQLPDGSIQLSLHGQHGEQRIRMWVDANHPAIRIEIHSDKDIEISCTTELLRPQPFTLPEGNHPLSGSFRGVEGSRKRPFESADHLK